MRLARDLRVSDKRLCGWEPTETQVHEYDDEGRLIRTVVTREPEWDAYEVAKLQAFLEYEAGICACGLHKSVADTDPDLDMPERRCPVCAGLARNWRAIHHADEEATRALGERAKDPLTPLPGDGRHFSLALSVAQEMKA